MLANKMAMIQFFPYHSNKFKYSKQYLPSQEYNFSLVLEAMANKKLIVCLRSFKKWEDGLTYYLQKYPELKGNEKLQFHFNEKKGRSILENYKLIEKQLIELDNPRSTYISENNLKKNPEAFKQLVEALIK